VLAFGSDKPGAEFLSLRDREALAATIAAVRPVITALSPIRVRAGRSTARSRAGRGALVTLAAGDGRPGISTDTPGLADRYLPEGPVSAEW